MDLRPWSCADASTRCCSTWHANRRASSRRPRCCGMCGDPRRRTRRGRWTRTPPGSAASSQKWARPAGCLRRGAWATASHHARNYSREEAMNEQAELIRFGEQFRNVREQQGVSVAELAARTDISERRISSLEAGRLDPAYDVLIAL